MSGGSAPRFLPNIQRFLLSVEGSPCPVPMQTAAESLGHKLTRHKSVSMYRWAWLKMGKQFQCLRVIIIFRNRNTSAEGKMLLVWISKMVKRQKSTKLEPLPSLLRFRTNPAGAASGIWKVGSTRKTRANGPALLKPSGFISATADRYIYIYTRHDMTWHDMTWHGMAWHDMAWHDMTWHGMA